MGDVVELNAIVILTQVAAISGYSLEYFGSVPRLGAGFSGKTIKEAKAKAAAAVKLFVESGFPDHEQSRLEAASLEERLRSANGTAINLGSVDVLCSGHPPYIPSNEVRVTFYQFTQQGLASND